MLGCVKFRRRLQIDPRPYPKNSFRRSLAAPEVLFCRKPLNLLHAAIAPVFRRTRSDHPSRVPLPGQLGRGRHVAAAGEGQEGIRPVRGITVPGPVLPHPPALVPFLPVRPKPPQAQLANPLVELAPGKGRPRRRDRLPLAPGSLHDDRADPSELITPLVPPPATGFPGPRHAG